MQPLHKTVETVVTVVTFVTVLTKKLFTPKNCFHQKTFFFTKNHATSSHKKSRKIFTQKIMHSLNKNIGRIAKRCPENITLVVQCVKLLFPKVLRKYFLQ